MKRFDLPEIEDSEWLPGWLRDAITGYLQVALAVNNPYAVAAPALADLIRKSGESRVVDLASGGAGPWHGLVEMLKDELGTYPTVTLTDIRPNQAAAEAFGQLPGVSYRNEPVSALAVPNELGGVRTMFTALHHFNEVEVSSILAAARKARAPFLAAEATHRSVRGLLVMAIVPLLVLLLMPRVRPRRFLPLLLTYFPPIIPLLVWWDGFASTLRSYSAEELRALASVNEDPGYTWRVQEVRVRGAPIPVTLVVGYPVGR
jgi:hypothetical protein